ncbi:hypothetical protein [Yoonia sp. 208BN28-4]|uniref:hypothetical protein n=1 Tax=Yoonia sp. 208BN28-4 TaxID=3126505 RepID=UPI0030A94874
MLLRSLIALLILATPTYAAPGDPWEGTWRNSSHKRLWFFQDGDTLWGSASNRFRYIARVSPDGRTIRGTQFEKSRTQYLFEYTLSADGQDFVGDYVALSGATDAVPSSTNERMSGYRAETDWVRTELVDVDFVDANTPFDSILNMNNPMHVAWINFQAPFEQPDAPRVDIDDLPIPDAGNAGLWQVIDQQYGQIGTVAMDEDASGFVASGQVRIPDFQGGIPLLATFTEYSNNQTLDQASFKIVQSGDTQFATVNIRPGAGEQFDITFDGDFLGVDRRTMQLVWIEGSIPPLDPIDLSTLEIPEPGDFGLMRVTTAVHGQIGTVNWNQDRETLKVTMQGQIGIPEWLDGEPLDVIILEGPNVFDDAISLSHTASGTTVTMPALVEEDEGDQYFVTFVGAELSDNLNGDYTITVTHIPNSRPTTGTPPQEDLRILRIDTDRIPMGLAVQVFEAPLRDAPVIGTLPSDATGLVMRQCNPLLSDEQLRLNGEDLYNVMADRFCLVDAPDITGWVGGAFLTR